MPANVEKLFIKPRAKERTYQVNGITYTVTPKYLDEGEPNVKTRFERIIKNNLTQGNAWHLREHPLYPRGRFGTDRADGATNACGFS